MSNTIDQQFVEYIVKSLVGNPDGVIIERRIDEKGVLLELTVDPEDLGRVIGKRGATAQSLRTLLRALGTKNDARYNLKIVDNGSPAPRSHDGGGQVKADDRPAKADEPVSHDDDDAQDDDTSDVVSKTRKELDDLDDLDIWDNHPRPFDPVVQVKGNLRIGFLIAPRKNIFSGCSPLEISVCTSVVVIKNLIKAGFLAIFSLTFGWFPSAKILNKNTNDQKLNASHQNKTVGALCDKDTSGNGGIFVL